MEYKFIWDDKNDPYLMKLREQYKLDELVPKDKEEFAVLKNTVKWVHEKWKHQNKRPKHNDPLSILEEVEKGNGFRCVEYSIVLRGCLAALGIKARMLSLRAKDVETRMTGAGHVVVEAYLSDYKKWVMADPQFGTIPLLNTVPLNAVELKDALKAQKIVEFHNLGLPEAKEYVSFIEQYLFYFRFKFDQRIQNSEIIGLTFGPSGARKPTKFEGHDLSKSENDTLIHSEILFYPEP